MLTHLFKRIAFLAIAGLMLALFSPAPASTAAATKPATMEKQIKKLTNKTRANHHKRKLRPNACLQRFAKAQARKQARKKKMYHQDLGKILNKCPMNYVGENVAYGYTSAKSVHRAWMHSKGHRENILRKQFNRIGVGVARASNGRLYYAVVFGRKV